MSVLRKLRRLPKRHPHELLLLLTALVLVCFAFPALDRLSYLFYSLIALLLGRLGGGRGNRWSDRCYRWLAALALLAMWLWLLTPLNLVYSGVPLALSWGLLVGWSILRLIERLAAEPLVNRPLLMGAIAGYLLLGLTAGLLMGAVETIQPGSFQPLELTHAALGDQGGSVLASSGAFAEINYYAFVCLTTVGFGDISATLPLSQMLSVVTSVLGPLYMAVVMGVVIGRYASAGDGGGKGS